MRRPNSNFSYINKFKPYGKKQWQYLINSVDATYNILEGSVRSSKTTLNILAFCMALEDSPDILHLAVATTHSAAKTILFEGDGLGIKHYPDWQERVEIHNGEEVKFQQRIFEGQYEGNDCLILLPIEGSGMPIKYILAFGGNKADSHIGYRGFSVGLVIATEYDQLHQNSRNEFKNRTVASGLRKYFFDFNPNNPNHSVYKDMEIWEILESGKYNYLHMTLRDNPALTQERIDEIVKEYDPESVDYQRYILGLRISAAGLIYRVRSYNIIDLPKDANERRRYINDTYGRYIITADPGQNMSATVFHLVALTKDRKSVDILKEYHHRNADYKGLAVKETDDYVLDFFNFINECIEFMGFQPMSIHADEDITFHRAYRRLQYRHGIRHTLQSVVKDEIDDRIKTGNNLLYRERLRFNKDCVNTIESFKIAQYDPKAEDRGKYVRLDNPSAGTMIDAVDSVEYGFTQFKRELNSWSGV